MTTTNTTPAVDALAATIGDSHPQAKDHRTKPISQTVDTDEDAFDDEGAFDDEPMEMFPTRLVGDAAKPFVRELGYPHRDGVTLLHIDAEPRINNLPAPTRDDLVQEMDYHGNHRIVDQRNGTTSIWVGYTSPVYYCGYVGCTDYYGEGLYTAQEFAIRACAGWVLTQEEAAQYVDRRTCADHVQALLDS